MATGPIEESVVRISPDFAGFKAKLRAGLKAATEGTTGKVRIEADCRGLARSVRDCAKAALAGTSVKAKVDADCRGLARSVRNCVREAGREHVKVKVDVDGRAASREADSTLRQMERSSEGSARRISRTLSGALVPRPPRGRSVASDFALPSIVDLGAKGVRPTNLLLGAVTALSPALISVGSSAAMASTSVAALGAASIGTASVIGGLFGAFANVAQAMTLFDSARKAELATAAKGATQEVNNGRQIQSAQRAVADARRRVGDAVENVADAERTLARAQREAAEAQADLNGVRAEALRDLEDMREAASDLALDEEGASIALERALGRQQEVLADCASTELDRREAALDVAQAQDRLSDVERDRARAAKDLAGAERKGVDGSDAVVAARQRIADSNKRVRDAEKGVADAHRGVTDAQRGVADAAADLAEAQKTQVIGTDEVASAQAQLNDLLARMSPAGRAMFLYLRDRINPALEEFRRRMETAILPGFLDGMKAIASGGRDADSVLSIMGDNMERLGRITGDTARRLGKLATSYWFEDALVKINQENVKSFQHLNNAVLALVRPFMLIFKASAPLLTRFSAYVETLAVRFSDFIVHAEKTGALSRWFREAGDELAKWWGIAANLGSIVLSVFNASLPSGQGLVARLQEFTAEVAKWAQSPEGEARLRSFFEFFRNLPYRDIARAVTNLAGLYATVKLFTMLRGTNPIYVLFGWLATQNPALIADVLQTLSDSMGGLLATVNDNKPAVTTLLTLLAALKGVSVLRGLDLGGLLGRGAAGKGGVLGTLLGDSRTGVMNVTAGVVNVNGGVGGAGGSAAGAVGAAGGAAGKAGRVARVASAGGRLVKGGVIAAIVASIADPVVDAIFGKQERFSGGAIGKGAASGAVTGAGAGSVLGPAGAIAGGLYGAAAGGVMASRYGKVADVLIGPTAWKRHWDRLLEMIDWPKSAPVQKGPGGREPEQLAAINRRVGVSIATEAGAYRQLTDAMASHLTQLKRNNTASANGNRFLQDYIRTRKESVAATVEQAKAFKGQEYAEGEAYRQNLRSATALSDTLVKYGWTRKAADAYAASIYKIPKQWVTETRLPAIAQREAELKRVNAEIQKYVGTKEARLSIVSGSDAEKRLATALITQAALRHGKSFAYEKMKYDQQKNLATGGPVIGAGTATSDSIAARLSNGEHVWTAREVRAAGGHEHVEQMRRSVVAGYAAGGPVVWPFPVNISKTKAPGGGAADVGDVPAGANVGFPPWPGSPTPGRDTGVWRSIVALAKSSGIPFSFGNGYRAYSMAAPGRYDWHSEGRAVDFMGFNQDRLARFFASKRPLELIHRSNSADYGMSRGVSWSSGSNGALFEQHRNHVHVAMADGGVISEPVVGMGRSGATYSFGEHGPETVTPAGATVRLDRRDLQLLAQYIAAAASRPIDMDGRRVAEAVNSYAYLPAGV